jgi:hypothetical protein
MQGRELGRAVTDWREYVRLRTTHEADKVGLGRIDALCALRIHFIPDSLTHDIFGTSINFMKRRCDPTSYDKVAMEQNRADGGRQVRKTPS